MLTFKQKACSIVDQTLIHFGTQCTSHQCLNVNGLPLAFKSTVNGKLSKSVSPTPFMDALMVTSNV